MGVDADAAFEEAADARTLMPMQIGAAAWRERHTVAAQDERALWQGLQPRCELFVGNDPASRGSAAGFADDKFEAPHRRAVAAGLHGNRAFAVKGLTILQGTIRYRHGSMHH